MDRKFEFAINKYCKGGSNMEKLKQYGLILSASIVLTIFGLSRLSDPFENAQQSTHKYIQSMGGILDTATALTVTNGYIATNIVTGGIMLFVGLSFLCLTIYTVSKKISEQK
jgi:multisubunit Na+/H+ antiporter MnhG subunit